MSSNPENEAAETPKGANKAIYYGCSMLRVFQPGDILLLKPVKFDDIHNGDILTMRRADGKEVVHRVIGRDRNRFVITQGDNNPRPDVEHLRPEDEFSLVRAINREGRAETLPVSSGESGCREFRRNQRKRRFRQSLSPMLQVLLTLAFWRRPLTEITKFGSNSFYFYKDRPIAKLLNGKAVFLRSRDKLFYRIIRKGESPYEQE